MLATLLLALGAGPGIAHGQARQEYAAELTSSQPGAPTGLRQTIGYVNPGDPDGKPFAVEEIVLRLPPGARIDTGAPARCAASDAEFQLEGAAACPPETRVGTGMLSIDFGAGVGPVPRVVENDVTFFNNEDELILFSESTNTPDPPVRNAARFEVGERTFTSSVPPLPGAPPPEPFAAIKDVVNSLDAVTRGSGPSRAAYITAPPTCPPQGEWVITAVFTYRDGVVQTERSTTPCVARGRATPEGPPRDRGEGGPRGGEDRSPQPRSRPREGAPDSRARAPVEGGSNEVRELDDSAARGGGGELPFTGLAAGALGLLGAALTLAGFGLRRASR